MKKDLALNLLRIAVVLILTALFLFVVFHPKKTQTNILKAILSNSPQDGILVDLSLRHSGRLNVIFEAQSYETLEQIKKEFDDGISEINFKSNLEDDFDTKEILNVYKNHGENFLSRKVSNQIKQGEFEAIKHEALERLYNPLGINLLTPDKDPFMLFGDYLQSLGVWDTNTLKEFDGKYYDVLKLSIKNEIALSPSLLNTEMSKLTRVASNIEKKHDDAAIYLSGAPVHTYFASSNSIKEINIICVLSCLFIFLLCKFYFGSYKILLPIGISIAIGILSGYLLTSLLFDSIHVLTFVFSTTLIGICTDYSLHYFAHGARLQTIFKSLTISMLSTVCAFLMLLFSKIQLLEQIAVFTSFGLFCVYLFVVLFYPLIGKYFFDTSRALQKRFDISKVFNFAITKRVRYSIIVCTLLLSIFGIFRINFDDDIKNMYTPPKHLVEAEKLYLLLSEQIGGAEFLLVRGKSIQDLLEQEEKITQILDNEDYISLSKFLPSIKRQQENRKMREILYKKELNSHAEFLDLKTRLGLIENMNKSEFLVAQKLPRAILNNFMISDYSSVIILKNSNPNLIRTISEQNLDVRYINLQKDISQKVFECRHACIKLILPVVSILFLVLSFIYKPKNALKIIAPSIFGTLFAFGVLGLFYAKANLFHVLALFLIVGFSLDYSIFRFNGAKNSTASHSAVLISCATSVFSFLALSMTSFKLISALGFILALGLFSSYIFSLLLISNSDSGQDEQTQSI